MEKIREQLLDLVNRALKRMRIVNILGFFAGIIVGPGFILLGIALQKKWLPAGPGFFLLAWFVGGICSVILVILIVQMRTKSIVDRRLSGEINNGRSSLLWVYIEYRQSQTTGVPLKGTVTTKAYYHIYFLFDDGKQTKGWLGKDDAYALFKLIGTLFPDISLGWNQERYNQWKNNPASLKEQPHRIGDMKCYMFRNRV